MIYDLIFTKQSKKEWKKLGHTVISQFKKKLKERLINPKVQKDKLSGYNNIYKIKLRSSGFRLVYEVIDDKIIVLVLTVGKRENDKVYKDLEDRI
jgi:mRNA interferase RelE/StbE